MTEAVLFDLGGTLAQYYERAQFPGILRQCISEAQEHLRQTSLLSASTETVWQRVRDEDHEAADYRVRPLEERLARIFGLERLAEEPELALSLCRCFMRPIFALGRCYEDARPTLEELRSRGLRLAIVSNTPWGSPACLWREELVRLGLSGLVDVAVFCRDVGWRKPARQIFEFTLKALATGTEKCLFVGDEPRWDLAGSQSVGMRAVIIARRAEVRAADPNAIESLREVLRLVE